MSVSLGLQRALVLRLWAKCLLCRLAGSGTPGVDMQLPEETDVLALECPIHYPPPQSGCTGRIEALCMSVATANSPTQRREPNMAVFRHHEYVKNSSKTVFR